MLGALRERRAWVIWKSALMQRPECKSVQTTDFNYGGREGTGRTGMGTTHTRFSITGR